MFNYLRSPRTTLFLVSLIPLILVLIWFQDKTMLASAEQGLPFFNSLRTMNVYKSVWTDIGFGHLNPIQIPVLTLFAYSSIFQILNLPAWLFQACLFFILLTTALISVYYLFKTIIPEIPHYLGILAALFYVFNLFTLSQVWGRFLYSLIFLWAYLPLFLLLWILWIDTNKKVYLIALLISSFLFSNIYGIPASILTLWIPASLWCLFKSIKNKSHKFIFKGVIGLSLWLVCNIWWLYPFLVLKDSSYSGNLNSSNNLSSIEEVSKYFPLSDILLLKQRYLFGEVNSWAAFYNQTKILLISYLGLFFVFLGFFSFKNKNWAYIVSLFLISIFIVKGTNPPFGNELYTFLFNFIPITQVLRNPYEKFGATYLLSYAFLFTLGFYLIYKQLKFLKIVSLFAVVFLFFIYLSRQFWSGDLFPGYEYVKVPDYYVQANNFLNKYENNRILHMPINRGASIKYEWNYEGEEPAEFLFDRPSVSKASSIKIRDDFYFELDSFTENRKFPKILQVANIGTVLIHHDIKHSPFFTEQGIDSLKKTYKWDGVKERKNFGKLNTVILTSQNIEIFLVKKITKADSLKDMMAKITNDDYDVFTEAMVIPPIDLDDNELISNLTLPEMNYHKLDQTNYKISIRGATEPFVLVMPATFDNRWVAEIDSQQVSKHFKVNGFSNAWMIDKKGDYKIEVSLKTFPWE